MGQEGQGVVFIHWYSTVFRGDRFQEAVAEIAPVALRYGATDYRVYRARDDTYKFIQMASFETKVDWERYWYSEEFSDWRADYSSWYQVPVVPQWQDLVVHGGVEENPRATSPEELSDQVSRTPDIMPGPFGG
jgi:hypothetical protein